MADMHTASSGALVKELAYRVRDRVLFTELRWRLRDRMLAR